MVCRGKWSGTASYLCCSHGGGGVGAFKGLEKENSESQIKLYVCVGCNIMDNVCVYIYIYIYIYIHTLSIMLYIYIYYILKLF